MTRRLTASRIVMALIFACLAVVTTGCSKPSSKAELIWTEQVRLQDGEFVMIKRHVVMSHTRALGGGFSSAPVYLTSSVEPASDGAGFNKWNAPLVPIVLEKDPSTHEWLLVATIDGCTIWLRNGLPRPPYWGFRFRDGKWYRDAIPDWLLMREANLLVDFDVDDESSRLTGEAQSRKDAQATSSEIARQYKKVDIDFAEFGACGRDQPTRQIGENELDLGEFGRLK